MAKYRLKSPNDEQGFENLAVISHNLRFYSKIWKEHYGSTNLNNMVYWQTKMDEWLLANVDYSEKNEVEGENEVKNQRWGERIETA